MPLEKEQETKVIKINYCFLSITIPASQPSSQLAATSPGRRNDVFNIIIITINLI